MSIQKIPFRGTHSFNEFFLKYIEQDDTLKPYYEKFPSISNFKEVILDKSKSFPEPSRKILVESLKDQYKKVKDIPATVQGNIESLLEKTTFTVTTGHQLSIFTGPLYFIYKIVTVVNACKKLKAQYPKYNFVPVYWMASEDHDYEEIKSFRLYENKYTWETQQQGAVGRFHTRDFANILSQLPGDLSPFKEAYLKSQTLSEAVRVYVTALFGHEGVVVMDADNHNLKRLLQPVIKNDLFENMPFKKVEETNTNLKAIGFHPQVNPREINFFFIDESLRNRLEKRDEAFVVVDTNIQFSKKEIEQLIESSPEKFSPNVILRPLYQEIILPNLAYVGGPAELVYWLQLKSTFEQFNIPFPVLLPRNFGLIIDGPVGRKLSKTGLSAEIFFEEKNYLYNHWVSKHSNHNLSLVEPLSILEKQLAEIQKRCEDIDPTLTRMVNAEGKRLQHAFETIEHKMLRAEKRRHSDKLKQIDAVKDALFPNGGLQERIDNFLNFYQKDPSFILKIIDAFDPFDFQMNVLSQND